MGKLVAKKPVRTRYRTVAFTDKQMMRARDSGKFADHRAFIKWLFKTNHGVVVNDYNVLVWEYITDEPNKCVVMKITGTIGQGLTLI